MTRICVCVYGRTRYVSLPFSLWCASLVSLYLSPVCCVSVGKLSPALCTHS